MFGSTMRTAIKEIRENIRSGDGEEGHQIYWHWLVWGVAALYITIVVSETDDRNARATVAREL